jgi:hypothetical protein
MLDGMGPAERRDPRYWTLRLRDEVLSGGSGEAARHMLALTGRPLPESWSRLTLNPLNENGLYSGDRWGYRRIRVTWPSMGLELPAPTAGMLRWIYHPRESVQAAGVPLVQPGCQP